MADQAVFALSNFALNLLLARWLPVDQYGAFALSYSLFLLLGTVHTSLLTEPMLVFGSGRHASSLAGYARIVLQGHWVIVSLGAAALIIAGSALHIANHPVLGSAFLTLAVAAPCLLLSWLLRRISYIAARPRWAVEAGVIYACLVLSGALLLRMYEVLSVATGLATLAGGGLGASLWLLRRLRITVPPGGEPVAASAVRAEHWSYGRWSLGSNALFWASGDVQYVLLTLMHGLGGAAAFRAVMNCLLPMLHVQTALISLLLPAASRARGQPRFRRLLSVAAVALTGAALVYWAILSAVAGPLVQWLYNGRYDQFAGVLLLLGFFPVLGSLIEVLAVELRAIERPDLLFWGLSISALVAAAAGLVGIALWGVWGAGVAKVLSAAALLAFLWALRARGAFHRRRTEAGEAGSEISYGGAVQP